MTAMTMNAAIRSAIDVMLERDDNVVEVWGKSGPGAGEDDH